MKFERGITIHCKPEAAFVFLRDKDQFQQEPGSPVLVLEKTTPGPVGVGTRYREVVQMFPFVKGEILSTVQHYEPSRFLEELLRGTGMKGYLAYEFISVNEGTLLVQRETIQFHGLFGLFSPLMERMLLKAVEDRLEGIKVILGQNLRENKFDEEVLFHIVGNIDQCFQRLLAVDQYPRVLLLIHNHHDFASFRDHHLNSFRYG